MKKFEYCYIEHPCGDLTKYARTWFSKDKSIDIAGKHIPDVLNDLGKDGWEMVGCGTRHDGSEHNIYFKREII